MTDPRSPTNGFAEGRAEATKLAAEAYVDGATYERERRAIFAREWAFVTEAARLSGNGDYLATSIAGYPIVIANDGGGLRGFQNVCRHRGGALATEGTGSCSSFTCQYHGWNYALDGSLRTARDFGDDELNIGQLGLHAVSVQSWRGLVFANLDTGAPALVRWLGGMANECDGYDIESFRATHRSSHHIAANWKVYAENYQEGYHIPLVHPGLNRQIDARRYEVDLHEEYAVHRAPTRDGSVTSGAWLWRFPGLAINLYPDGMCIETYVPTGPASTRIDYVFFFSEQTTEEEEHAAVASSTQILEEDRAICEAVQRNYESGLYAGGVLSPRFEQGVALVQSLVLRALARDGAAHTLGPRGLDAATPIMLFI